ncbi:MAG: TRAP transporter small permease [Thermoactinomyces sp.]
MNQIRKFIQFLDRSVEIVGAVMMIVMVLIVCWQVFGRYVLHSVPSWSEEVALLLMMWYGFLSIGIGFRYKLHLRISMFVEKLPKQIQRITEALSNVLIVAFGLLLIIEGTKFSLLTWTSTLPVTKLPTGVQYIIIPITGVLTMLYGLVWLLGWKEREHDS